MRGQVGWVVGCFTIEGQPSSYEESPPTSGQVPGQPVEAARPAALTYLFADIRGYTDFTAAHGADAAALLASRFIRLATDAVAAEHGRVGGTWGDEVLAEFASARDAVRAALGLQAECIRATVANGDGPMLVGVGLDVGEASSGEEEGRALALNTAARLCSRAGPGEVLTTRELVHLTGSMPGVVFDDRGRATLKGIPGRTPLVRVRPATQDRAELAKFHAVVDQLPRRRQARRRRRALVASLLVGAVLAGGASWAVSRLGPSGPPTIPGESVGVIDAGSGTLLATVTLPAGQHADALGVAGDSVWLVDSAGGTVSWIDRDTMKVRQVTGVGHTPVSAVDFAGSLWVVNQGDGTVSKISHESPQEGQPLRVGKQPTAIAAAFGSLWVVNRADNTVTRLDGHGVRQGGDIPVGDAPAGVAVSRDKVWVTNSADNTVSTIDPDDVEARTPPLAVGAGPQAVLAAAGEVFVANRLDLTVSRIDPLDRRETARPAVGDTPSGLARRGVSSLRRELGGGDADQARAGWLPGDHLAHRQLTRRPGRRRRPAVGCHPVVCFRGAPRRHPDRRHV